MSMAPALPSYSNGPSTVPLLGDTIGANLDRTAARMSVTARSPASMSTPEAA